MAHGAGCAQGASRARGRRGRLPPGPPRRLRVHGRPQRDDAADPECRGDTGRRGDGSPPGRVATSWSGSGDVGTTRRDAAGPLTVVDLGASGTSSLTTGLGRRPPFDLFGVAMTETPLSALYTNSRGVRCLTIVGTEGRASVLFTRRLPSVSIGSLECVHLHLRLLQPERHIHRAKERGRSG